MAGEKKKVNLVNLKTKFGVFLNNNYCCQNCYSIDQLAFGFTCDHKFCTNCNNNQTDQCKECKSEIDSVLDDKLQSRLFPYFEDLKNIMSIDLNKVANKMRQFNGQPIDNKKQQDDVEMREDKLPEQNNQVNDAEMKEDRPAEQNDVEENDKSTDNEKKQASRSSRRQASKVADESKNSSKKQASKDVEVQPAKAQSVRSRESSRSKEKNLKDVFKDNIGDEPAEAKENEKTVSKSTRKADKSNTKTTAKQPSIVIISTSITENELKVLNKFAKKFHAKIVTEFSEEVTHLVTLETKPKSRLTTRTLKYLKSLLSHKWLLDFKWIKDSLDNDKLVDEAYYELLGITKQTEDNLGAPTRSRENPILLFEGKKFYIDGKFGPKCGLPKNDYKELIKVGGGDVIESEKEVDDETYIIVEATHLTKSKYKGRKNSLTTTDFLNFVSDFRFDL